MTYRKIKGAALSGLFALSVCCLSGCSFSFCGFAVGGSEELAFDCREDEALQTERILAQASGESITETTETAAEETPGESETSTSTETAADDGKVDLNLAGAEELMTLSGVGETRAQAIITYRTENGPFQSIEDIMLVPGIKEGIFSKIKEQIAVH